MTANPTSKTTAPKTSQPIPQIAEGHKGVLHVGCGRKDKTRLPPLFQTDEWQEIRLDIDPSVKPDIVSDITNMEGVPDNYCDALFSSHNLEHIYNYQVADALREFARVVKNGGMAIITLPDLQAVAFEVARGLWDKKLYQSPAGPVTPRDIFYGMDSQLASGRHYMAHKNGFIAHSLGRSLLKAGFCNVVVERDNKWNLWARAVKLPKDHPDYREQAQIKAQYPYTVERRAQAGEGASKRTDELDAEPRRWQPPALSA